MEISYNECMKFIADCHLGKVAKYLRIFGFDTLYFQSIDDNDILCIAQKEGRIILTSDRELYSRAKGLDAFYVLHARFEEQLERIFLHFKLFESCAPLSRCIKCNGNLVKIKKSEVIEELQSKTKKYFDNFYRCEACGSLYWHGDHYKNMLKFVNHFIAQHSKKRKSS